METQSSKRIFLTGGAGFVGSAVIDELLARDYHVTALLHRGELDAKSDRLKVVRGDLFSEPSLNEAVAGSHVIIHLVGIIREIPHKGVLFDRIHIQGTRNLMEAARRAGAKRFIHMSALGAREDAVSEYHKTKFQAEKALRKSNLDWTIFRPSLIHGPAGEFLKMEADWARGKRPPFFFMPYFGGGLLGLKKPSLVQPVHVKDVARAFVEAIEKPKTIGQTYCLGGAQKLTWPQMHHLAAEIFTGKRKPAIGVPAWYASALTHIVPGKFLPFTRDQIIMGQEDSVCDMSPFIAELGWEPRGFGETVREYADQLPA